MREIQLKTRHCAGELDLGDLISQRYISAAGFEIRRRDEHGPTNGPQLSVGCSEAGWRARFQLAARHSKNMAPGGSHRGAREFGGQMRKIEGVEGLGACPTMMIMTPSISFAQFHDALSIF